MGEFKQGDIVRIDYREYADNEVREVLQGCLAVVIDVSAYDCSVFPINSGDRQLFIKRGGTILGWWTEKRFLIPATADEEGDDVG